MIGKIIASLLSAIFLLSTASMLSACNTIEGAGKDVQAGGKAIKDEAQEHKSY